MKKNVILNIFCLFISASIVYAAEMAKIEYEENYEFNEFEFEEQEGISEEKIVDYQQNPVAFAEENADEDENSDSTDSDDENSELTESDEDVFGILPDDELLFDSGSEISDKSFENDSEDGVNDEEYLEKYVYEKKNFIYSMNLLKNPRRVFEIGYKFDTGISNNYFAIKDIMVEELVFDLPQMSEDIPDDGWQIDFCFNTEFYANLTLKKNWQFGIASGVESSGLVNVSKKLFDYLGKGFNLYEPLHVGGEANGDAFYYTNAYAGFDIYGFHVKVKPAIIKPLIHLETKDVHAAYINNSDGSILVKTLADIVLYGGIDLEPLLENDFSASNITADLFKNVGFDIELEVEHRIFDGLQCGAYIRVPMVPGKLTHRADIELSYEYEVENFKALINGDYEDPKYKDGEKTYSSADMNIHRPFRTGLEAAYRPFGDFFTVSGLLGLGVKNPYSGDAKAFAEYNLCCESIFSRIIGGWVSTGYLNQVFKHEAGIIFNCRVFEMDLGLSMQGSNLEKSLNGTGVGVSVNFAFGF